MPQAGSQMRSPGCGSSRATIMAMMWRGVRNWPLVPDIESLLSRYSYMSPFGSSPSWADRSISWML